MSESPVLLEFFKALADANRLRIVGLLARRPHTVEELAEVLELRPSTTSHHVARLAATGLVSGRPDGHYHVYALDTDALERMARELLATAEAPAPEEVEGDAFDRKVVAAFTGTDGRLTAIPMKRKKFEAILRHVARRFEPGRTYTELEVNDVLRTFADDVASLRRGLIDTRMMRRDPSGARYALAG